MHILVVMLHHKNQSSVIFSLIYCQNSEEELNKAWSKVRSSALATQYHVNAAAEYHKVSAQSHPLLLQSLSGYSPHLFSYEKTINLRLCDSLSFLVKIVYFVIHRITIGSTDDQVASIKLTN